MFHKYILLASSLRSQQGFNEPCNETSYQDLFLKFLHFGNIGPVFVGCIDKKFNIGINKKKTQKQKALFGLLFRVPQLCKYSIMWLEYQESTVMIKWIQMLAENVVLYLYFVPR